MIELFCVSYYKPIVLFLIFGCFTLIGIGVIFAIYVSRHSHIKEMDEFFMGYSLNAGIPFNSMRIGLYVLYFTFPSLYGKSLRRYLSDKGILKEKYRLTTPPLRTPEEISEIPFAKKFPYMFSVWTMCLSLILVLLSYSHDDYCRKQRITNGDAQQQYETLILERQKQRRAD